MWVSPLTRAHVRRPTDGGIDGVARQVSSADFETFDVIAAVDEQNLDALQAMATPGASSALRLLGRQTTFSTRSSAGRGRGRPTCGWRRDARCWPITTRWCAATRNASSIVWIRV